MTQAAHDWTDPYLEIYRQIPRAGRGVCHVCHSGPSPGYRSCASCSRTMGQVSAPTTLILPISLYRLRGQLHTFLRGYKDGTADVSATAGAVLAATLARFAVAHWDCIRQRLGGPVDVVTTVPSTTGRAEPHPVHSLVDRSRLLRPLHRVLLQSGAARADHNLADDAVFVSRETLDAADVLVIDDTYTTGARAQSAASALYRAGARTVAVLAIGRVIDPDYNESCRLIWRNASRHPFTFDTCCWCP